MSATLEDMVGIAEIFWVVVFNPLAWLVITALALKRVRFWLLVLFGTLAHFVFVIGLLVYNDRPIADLIADYELTLWALPFSFAAACIISLAVRFLLRLRGKPAEADELASSSDG